MIAEAQVVEIRRLLNNGWSQRRVAATVGVSRATVGSIAAGRRVMRPMLTRPVPPLSGPYRRCPSCGARVQMPCLACRLRGGR